jgi:hypothetical protein
MASLDEKLKLIEKYKVNTALFPSPASAAVLCYADGVVGVVVVAVAVN